MNIVIGSTFNEKIIVQLKIMLYSISQFHKADITFLGMNISDYDKEYYVYDLQETALKYGINSFTVIDLQELPIHSLIKCVYYNWSLPHYDIIASKLYLPWILPNIDKCLWLDTDTFMCANCDEMYNLDLTYRHIAAVSSSRELREAINEENKDTVEFIIKENKDAFLINAGVLLFNLKLIRKDFTPKLIHAKVLDGKCFNYYIDEFVLTQLYMKTIIQLDQRWNYRWHYYDGDDIKPKIVHAAGPKKRLGFDFLSKNNNGNNDLCGNLYQNFLEDSGVFDMKAVMDINVAVCFSENYCMLFKVMLYSLCKYNYNIRTVYIINCSLHDDTVQMLQDFADNVCHVHIEFVNVKDNVSQLNKFKQFEKDWLNIIASDWGKAEDIYDCIGLEINKPVPLEQWSTVFIPELLPETLDRVLYLDADLLIQGDIKNFYYAPMTACITAIADAYLSTVYPHFNSGVILYDLKRIREKNIVPYDMQSWRWDKDTEEAAFFKSHAKNLIDQYPMNIAFKNEVEIQPAYLNPYNLVMQLGDWHGGKLPSYKNTTSRHLFNASIIHFIGAVGLFTKAKPAFKETYPYKLYMAAAKEINITEEDLENGFNRK